MNFVFDLDGTICFKGQPVSEKITCALERLTRVGHQVIFASARPIRDMLPVLRKPFFDYTMIGGNGSLIYKNGAIKNVHSFSSVDVKKLLSLIQEFKATFLIDGDWNYSYTGPADHPILQNVDPAHLAKRVPIESLTSIVKVLILGSRDNKQLAERLDSLNLFVTHHTNEDVLDISPTGISKWSALESLGVKNNAYCM
ncbi:HAD-IIB family hydrolase [Sporolactobacillus shoreae]|uniref:HAD-IIB family hydrolase n=1 Tax=Sporolactobacillus shoreae TaxID=1465501 RepID=A0A4Z0GIC5_9BACL|nr:HAD-IIB family hydrolase [Sporolactobacillus shoreae]TGA96301.1 HAD-IIB family hydrolase [Sporolactobacillus shoreae]